jgi:hypothetical protein
MNDDAVKFVAWLEKAATIRTPVGSAYAIALALMHVAAQLEKIAEKATYEEQPWSLKTTPKK